MLEITASIFSAYGRAASAAICARRSFDAGTICMALVIFCVALVEAMRTRMSFSEAILSSPWRPAFRAGREPLVRHARPCAGHPRLDLVTCKDVDGRVRPGHDGKLQANV